VVRWVRRVLLVLRVRIEKVEGSGARGQWLRLWWLVA
jgi:hypothetical protein